MTPGEKVALFRSLFRGRDDVFPRLWTNRRTGKKGYAPACANEWVRGICEKPRVKCGECPSQAFTAVADQVILDHLQGRHVVGTYPLLQDETCWLLAADFDKASWVEDVSAFAQTCREMGLPVAIERSRSGNGAHVWFFFSAPVPAAEARRMGCFLITQTMARHHLLSMESYDRLFPNQDTLPRGGFGNLIALPLQTEPRKKGNTEFLTDDLKPYADQWGYLASIKRIDPAVVAQIVAEAARRGQVIGIRLPDDGTDPQRHEPWERPPSQRHARVTLSGPMPREVNLVLAQRVFIETSGLPSALLNQIKRLAAFQNPEFFKKQSLRLSTALTPRVIDCSEFLDGHVALPRGCLNELEVLLREVGTKLVVRDERKNGDPLELVFNGSLTKIQQEATKELLRHEVGVLVAPPGSGKTVVGAYLVAVRARSTLVLVHRQPLLDQWVARLSLFLGIDPKEIGQLGGGKRRPNGRLDVAMIQSLVRGESVEDIVASYGHVIVDECHHVPAVSFERVLREVRARFVTGLTATAQRRDGHQPILHMQLGPTRFVIDPRKTGAIPSFRQRLLVKETGFSFSEPSAPSIQRIYAALTNHAPRNEQIVRDVTRALDEGRSPIVLTERRDHLDLLESSLRPFCPALVVLRGGTSSKVRREALARLSAIPAGDRRLVLATGRYIGEGFDDARLDTLFLAMPISWKGTLVQYAGRLSRPRSGKTEVCIYDYVDRSVPMLARMFERRMNGYRAIGYSAEAKAPMLDLSESEAAQADPRGDGSW
ncbi:MAG: DEAD/DEAH box helicase family protein [Thermoanaerobaculia bacterium]